MIPKLQRIMTSLAYSSLLLLATMTTTTTTMVHGFSIGTTTTTTRRLSQSSSTTATRPLSQSRLFAISKSPILNPPDQPRSGGGSSGSSEILPLELVAQEWTAALCPPNEFEEGGVKLLAKTKADYQPDRITLTIDSRTTARWGLELWELAGGRSDKVGIVLVENVLDGGCIAEAGLADQLFPGDSLVEIVIQERAVSNNNNEAEWTTVAVADLECLDYDATMDALQGLPGIDDSPSQKQQRVLLTVKRLRRRPKVTVVLQYPPSQKEPSVSFELLSGENLRRALLARQIKLNDALARRFDSGGPGDCGAEGTCCTCAVNVVRGGHLLNQPGLTEEQMLIRRNPRWRLACKAVVGYGGQEGELVLRVNPRQWAD